ncbi:MAG: hypothetical protein AAF449_06025 [Myxococcota bacterium]
MRNRAEKVYLTDRSSWQPTGSGNAVIRPAFATRLFDEEDTGRPPATDKKQSRSHKLAAKTRVRRQRARLNGLPER